MGTLTFITGGARSGKSSYAQNLLKNKKKVTYLATALPFDEGMKERIRHHRESRPATWETIEIYKNFSSLETNSSFKEAENVLLDCITLLISNQMLDLDLNWDQVDQERVKLIEENILSDIDNLLELSKDKNLILVSNEVGMGVVPDNYLSSYFRDIAGRINQYLAKKSDSAFLLASGIPIQLK